MSPVVEGNALQRTSWLHTEALFDAFSIVVGTAARLAPLHQSRQHDLFAAL